jgi:hypothetical protein
VAGDQNRKQAAGKRWLRGWPLAKILLRGSQENKYCRFRWVMVDQVGAAILTNQSRAVINYAKTKRYCKTPVVLLTANLLKSAG